MNQQHHTCQGTFTGILYMVGQQLLCPAKRSVPVHVHDESMA
jgi:hypothetical protein